jgi:L-alanine-DL-glutamate epimerase-like enolase superfamily enzyme
VSKPTDIRLLSLACDTAESPFRAPLKFGGQVVTHSIDLHVTAQVETRDGRRGVGHGWMPQGNVWGFPSKVVSAAQASAAGLELFRSAVAATAQFDGYAHPIDIAWDCEPLWLQLAADVGRDLALAEPIPKLFALVETSPIDAALHDAYGQALGRHVYGCYGPEFANHDLGRYLGPDFAGQWLDQYVSPRPKERLPLYHLVGALDPLTPGEVDKPIGDGLPEHLIDWIVFDELTHLKIKLNGEDVAWDAARVAAVERAAAEGMSRRGCADWVYSLDFNERAGSVDYILEFLGRTEELAPRAFGRVAYIEQPTARDLRAHPENTMHAVSAIKPVVIDESLTDQETYELAKAQGYSGVALKTCKGHSQALLMAACAQRDGLFLCVQDLTCPGAAFLHSAGLAAHIPAVTAIEGNGRQYCPGSNVAWAAKYPAVFKPRDGMIATGLLSGAGLGH